MLNRKEKSKKSFGGNPFGDDDKSDESVLSEAPDVDEALDKIDAVLRKAEQVERHKEAMREGEERQERERQRNQKNNDRCTCF